MDRVVAQGVEQDLLRRVGSRTGLVELMDAAGGPPPLKNPRIVQAALRRPNRPQQGPSHKQRLVDFLGQHDGPVHMLEIAGHLGLRRDHADNVVWSAVKAGLVRRVAYRTGLVELVKGQVEVDPSTLTGIQRRVFDALVTLEGWSTAKGVAGALGCRPREAGNTLALLVEVGLVDRRRGDGTPGDPSRYLVRTNQ